MNEASTGPGAASQGAREALGSVERWLDGTAVAPALDRGGT
ncbi:MAG: hypothetical protein RIS86_876, partial [Planctomycetota bacterium]